MSRHSRKNRIAVQPQTTRIVVSETKVGPTVWRRQFAPFAMVVGLIADAIASEKARASAPAAPATTAVSAPRNGTASKSNGHGKPTTAALLPESPTTLHRNPDCWRASDSDCWDYYHHIPERSWKRYRTKQWRDGNRWSCRREVLASASW